MGARYPRRARKLAAPGLPRAALRDPLLCLARNAASLAVLGARFRSTGGGNPDPKWGPEDRFLLFRLTRADWEAARGFADHFSGHAADYAAHRPGYPPELFARVAALAVQRRLAWDTGTGNGQAAVHLAAHFERVVAPTPAPSSSPRRAAPRVEYRIARGGVGLPEAPRPVTAAQRCTGPLRRILRQVRRVLAPGAPRSRPTTWRASTGGDAEPTGWLRASRA